MLPLQGSGLMSTMETFAWQEKRKLDDVQADFMSLRMDKAWVMNHPEADPDFSKKDLLVSLQWLYFSKKTPNLITLQDEESFEFAKYVMSKISNEIAGLSDSDYAKMQNAGRMNRVFEEFSTVENLEKLIAQLEKN